MTATAARDVTTITPIAFSTDARQVALSVYDRLLQLVEQLGDADWDAPTECPAWNVSDMVGHLIGAAKANASVRESVRQQVWALRHKSSFDGNDLDAMNALQVRMHAALSPAQRVAALRAAVPAAVAGRMRFPRLLRRVRVPVAQSGSSAGMPRSLSLGHLMEVIYTRDVWMHRIDIARATGLPLHLDAAVDARVIEDVVAEWAAQHGEAFVLSLHGPAGGDFCQGVDGQRLELDAIDFCRTISGRVPGDGLLAVLVLF